MVTTATTRPERVHFADSAVVEDWDGSIIETTDFEGFREFNDCVALYKGRFPGRRHAYYLSGGLFRVSLSYMRS